MDVVIDGQLWRASEPGERVVVHLAEGMHQVEIRKRGYRTFSMDLDVRAAETVALNVSLSPEVRE